MMKMHVVCFQVPYPPLYGGLIDEYYKLKALHEAGCEVVVHTFCYGGSRRRKELETLASEVFYYPRHTGWMRQLSFLPYIVGSRSDELLLRRLGADDAPVLFEGLHTCRYLSHPALARKRKFVRMHNVEHEYYAGLARNSRSFPRKCYYLLESWRLRRFEGVLRHADVILAITEADASHFRSKYPMADVRTLPCFFDTDIPLPALAAPSSLPFGGNYVFYQGNLSVEENEEAVRFLVRHVLPLLGDEIPLVVAGHNPGTGLRKLLSGKRALGKVRLVADPSKEEMDMLVANARVVLLYTNQPTGIKLKLLHTLTLACGEVLANHAMIPDTGFRLLCEVADEDDFPSRVRQLWQSPLSPERCKWRRQQLHSMGYCNDVSILLR